MSRDPFEPITDAELVRFKDQINSVLLSRFIARIDADAKRIAELKSVLREISSGKAPCDMGDVVLTAARLSGLARRALATGETTSVPASRR